MTVRLLVEDGPHPGVARARVLSWARSMLAALQLEDAEWSIVLTGDDQIQKLNRMYRRKNRPTDVLAFAQREGPVPVARAHLSPASSSGRHAERAGRLLGDVIVSVPTARRQAASAKRDLASEIVMLLAHGLLHLLGWDHDTPSRDRRMRRETERLCRAARARSAKPASR
jgi:probable rRNA maturation factor